MKEMQKINVEVYEIIYFITNHRRIQARKDDYTFIITGEPGPSGKTFLRDQLKSRGYKAIEIAENLYDLVRYNDNNNYIRIDHENSYVLIVLNKSCVY